MSDLMRRVIDKTSPKGSAWRVNDGSDSDKFNEARGINWEIVRQFLDGLSGVKDPHFTTFLADLEREYGVLTNPVLTEQQRREQLSSIVFNRSANGSVDNMQIALNDAGFNVTVYENSPAVDPAIFLDEQFQMVADGGNAFAGRVDAFAGRVGGELLVNGEIFSTSKLFTSVAGTFYAGNTVGAGEYSELLRTQIEYPIPTDPNDWPLVFFVGGPATFNGSGEITAIELADVPTEQESAFKRIILKNKPIHSWAALIINYT